MIRQNTIRSFLIDKDYLVKLIKGSPKEARSVASLTIECLKEIVPNLTRKAVYQAGGQMGRAKQLIFSVKNSGEEYDSESLEAVTEAIKVGYDLVQERYLSGF